MFSLYVRNDNSNNILGVFRPIYIIARIVGLFPFSIKLQQSFALIKPFISKVDFILFTLHMAVYASFALFNILTDTSKYIQASSVLEIGNRAILIGGILCGIAAVVFDLLNRKKVWKVFQKFERFDQEV